VEKLDLSVNLGRVKFKNPLLAASGTFGYGEEFSNLEDLSIWAGFVAKTLTLHPKSGNPSPRIYEAECGVINSIGLENPGLEYFLINKIEILSKFNTNVFISIYGRNINEWQSLVEKIEASAGRNIVGFELNLSCPNLKGKIISYSLKETSRIIKDLRHRTKKLLIPKLSFSGRIADIAKVCMDCGADAVTLINTLPAMAVDINSQKPVLGAKSGGLSGPAIKPVALNAVYQVYRALKAPLIASGGVFNYKDVLEFMLAGAKLVQLGTVNFVDFKAAEKCLKGLEYYCRQKNIRKLERIIGKANEKM